MPNEAHHRKLENMYHAARCNEYFQPRMSIHEGTAELVIPIREDFFHAAGATHGAVYFKALDDSTFFSTSSLVDDVMVLTTSFHLFLLRPISSGTMRAVGKVVHVSHHQIIAEGVVYDDQAREIARGTGTFARSKIRLSEELGYK